MDFKVLREELWNPLNEMFTKTTDRHNRGTRQKLAQILYKYPTRTDIGRNKIIRHLLPEIVNKTQSCITEKVSTHSFNGFSTYVKKHMINNYSEHCHIQNCYICHKQNWASFRWLFSISYNNLVRMTMTLSIHVSISLFFFFSSLLYMSYL